MALWTWPHAAAQPPPPALTVPVPALDAALRCEGLEHGRRATLLVHGTSVTAEENWSWNYVRALPAEGFGVCTVDLPNRAFDDIQVAAEYVVHGIRRMHAATGAKVSVVGISQGGLQPRWAIKWWPDVRRHVDDLVMIASPNHGGPFANLSCTEECIPAMWQMRDDSMFMEALNEGDKTPGDISYSSIYSVTDAIIQPSSTTRLEGASWIAVQDICPGRPVDHAQTGVDAVVYALVIDALAHPGPTDAGRLEATVCARDVMPHVERDEAARRWLEVYATAVREQAAYPKVKREPAPRDYVRGTVEPPVALQPPTVGTQEDQAALPASGGRGLGLPALTALAFAAALLPRRNRPAVRRIR